MLSPEMRSSALKNRVVAATLFILTLYLKSICCEVGAFFIKISFQDIVVEERYFTLPIINIVVKTLGNTLMLRQNLFFIRQQCR